MANNREAFLKLAVGAVLGLYVLDHFVLEPSIDAWKEQSQRLEQLRDKVTKGRNLIERETQHRNRWADMVRTCMPDDNAAGEADVYKALSRWAGRSRVSFTSLTPSWRAHEEDGYDTFECRIAATGDQASIGRFMYELEVDPLPAHIEECEMITKDPQGKQLNLTMRFSFVRINEARRVMQ